MARGRGEMVGLLEIGASPVCVGKVYGRGELLQVVLLQ
jgi:hypothetical protein